MKTEIKSDKEKFDYPCLMRGVFYKDLIIFFNGMKSGTVLSLDKDNNGYSLGEYRTDWIAENFVCLGSSESVILTNS